MRLKDLLLKATDTYEKATGRWTYYNSRKTSTRYLTEKNTSQVVLRGIQRQTSSSTQVLVGKFTYIGPAGHTWDKPPMGSQRDSRGWWIVETDDKARWNATEDIQTKWITTFFTNVTTRHQTSFYTWDYINDSDSTYTRWQTEVDD